MQKLRAESISVTVQVIEPPDHGGSAQVSLNKPGDNDGEQVKTNNRNR